jgi:hypothetical protein
MWRHLDGSLNHNRVITEEMVNANSVRIMLLDCIIHPVPNKTTIAVSFGHVIRELTLHEICGSTLSVPLDQVFVGVLHHETIHSHIISIDDGTILAWIVPIDDASSSNGVICAPQPEIVAYHVS